jgi:hypothetical protein
LILAPLLDTIFNKAILSSVVQGRGFGSGGDEDFAFVFFGGCFEGVGLGLDLDLALGLHSDLDLNLDLMLDWVLGNLEIRLGREVRMNFGA